MSSSSHPDLARKVAHQPPQLPAELWTHAFSLLPFAVLLHVSHVCDVWRTLAHRHPTFWRDVELADPTPGGVALFLLRIGLSSAEGRLVHTCLRLGHWRLGEHDERRQEVLAPVWHALERTLIRTRELNLTIEHGAFLSMAHALTGSAPVLEKARIEVVNVVEGLAARNQTQGQTTVLPAQLFAGDAPNLESLEIVGADFDLDRERPVVFPQVTHLVAYGHVGTTPSLFFTPFPNLHHLTICQREVLAAKEDSTGTSVEYLEHVPLLTVRMLQGQLRPSRAAIRVLAGRQDLRFINAHYKSIGAVLCALEEDLRLEVAFDETAPYRDLGDEVMRTFVFSDPRGRTRTFIEDTRTAMDFGVMHLNQVPSVMRRVKSFALTVDSKADWPRIGRAAVGLDCVEELAVRLNSVERMWPTPEIMWGICEEAVMVGDGFSNTGGPGRSYGVLRRVVLSVDLNAEDGSQPGETRSRNDNVVEEDALGLANVVELLTASQRTLELCVPAVAHMSPEASALLEARFYPISRT